MLPLSTKPYVRSQDARNALTRSNAAVDLGFTPTRLSLRLIMICQSPSSEGRVHTTLDLLRTHECDAYDQRYISIQTISQNHTGNGDR